MTMSKNGMSWDTIKHVTSLAAWRYDANQATDAASKWLVGSSSSKMSARTSIARMISTFIFHPPERHDRGDVSIVSVN